MFYTKILLLGFLLSTIGCATLNREVRSISKEEIVGIYQKDFRKKTYEKSPMQIKQAFGEPFSVGYQGEGDRIYYMAYPIGTHDMKVSTLMLSKGIYCYIFEFYAEDGYILKPGYHGDNHTGQFCEHLKNGSYRFNDSKIKTSEAK